MVSDEQFLLSNPIHTDANLYAQELREQEQLLLSVRSRSMTPSEAIAIQRRVSHGIGGAGNIRRPSEVMFAAKEKEAETGKRRRRSFVWSILGPAPVSNPTEKRNSILSIFRSGSGRR